jgi:hypothetical protein
MCDCSRRLDRIEAALLVLIYFYLNGERKREHTDLLTEIANTLKAEHQNYVKSGPAVIEEV